MDMNRLTATLQERICDLQAERRQVQVTAEKYTVPDAAVRLATIDGRIQSYEDVLQIVVARLNMAARRA